LSGSTELTVEVLVEGRGQRDSDHSGRPVVSAIWVYPIKNCHGGGHRLSAQATIVS